MHTFDSALSHLAVFAHFVVRKVTVFAEYDVEAHPEDTQGHQGESEQEYFHGLLVDELRADGLVIVHALDHAGEHVRHRDHGDL